MFWNYNPITDRVEFTFDYAANAITGERIPFCKILNPKKIIFNPPATIVFWNDGTKTVVKTNGDYFTAEGGLFAALARKMWGRAQTKKFIKQAKHVITTDNIDRWMHYGK